MIKDATNDSSKLRGIAKYNIPKGNTPKLPITTHIKINATNQERKAVSTQENFLEIIKIEIANNKDQSPQIAPLIDSEGKTRPSLP